MMCDHCGQHEATIFLTKVVNGEKTELHLCKQCAEHGDTDFFKDMSLVTILANLAGSRKPLPQEETMAPCPNCGFDLARLRREGRVGCEQCYKHFAAELVPMMRKIHGSLQHTGYRPQGKAPAEQKRAAEPKTKASVEAKPLSHLDELRVQLKAAIKGEEYERAATLRDEIRALETAEGGAAK